MQNPKSTNRTVLRIALGSEKPNRACLRHCFFPSYRPKKAQNTYCSIFSGEAVCLNVLIVEAKESDIEVRSSPGPRLYGWASNNFSHAIYRKSNLFKGCVHPKWKEFPKRDSIVYRMASNGSTFWFLKISNGLEDFQAKDDIGNMEDNLDNWYCSSLCVTAVNIYLMLFMIVQVICLFYILVFPY